MNLPWQSAARHFLSWLAPFLEVSFVLTCLLNVPYFPIRGDCTDRMARVVIFIFSCNQIKPGVQEYGI